jgi:L-asparagine transporter-like permease
VTSVVVMLFLAAVLVSTLFIEPLRPAWWAGVPFLIVLTVAYLITSRRDRAAV